MQRCRILLVDDNPLLLRVIARFLAEFPELEVVACSTSSAEGMAMAVIHRPDLLVMNLIMPEISGLEVTRRLAAEPWAPRTILMTLHDESEYRRAAEAAGADGFVTIQDLATKLLPLIRVLTTG
jgi:DNA-binding NarL/FixJ family response regulator